MVEVVEEKSIDQVIGERLRFFRIARGMKQKDLSDRLGISYQQVQKYETGRDKISISRLVEISEILDVEPAVFLNFSEDLAPNYNRQMLTMMKNFTSIRGNKERQAIADVIKIVASRYGDAEDADFLDGTSLDELLSDEA